MFDLVRRAELQTQVQALIDRLEEIARIHKEELEETRNMLLARISELEEEFNKPKAPEPVKEEPATVKGWIPPSVRKRQFEHSHRKDLSAKKKP